MSFLLSFPVLVSLFVSLVGFVTFRLSRPSAPSLYSQKIKAAADHEGHVEGPANIHDASLPGSIIAFDPATGHRLRVFPSLTPEEVKTALQRAEEASLTFKKTSFEHRKKILKHLLKWVLDNQESIARLCARDSGKTMIDASLGEILTTVEKLRWVIANVESCLAPDHRWNNLILAHKKSYVVYEPLGLVAAIVSWNYPFHNLISPIIAAIATGNAIVVKTSEQVAYSSHYFGEAISECLSACGQDPNIVQVLVGCEAEAAKEITSYERVGHCLFIGSEPVGRQVAELAGKSGIQVALELGGKDPCVILPSADLQFMRGAFQSAGQNCIGIERFLVHTEVYDEFVKMMAPKVRHLSIGAPLHSGGKRVDMGSMISDRPLAILERLINDAVLSGATLLAGGKRWSNPTFPLGHYFEPTLLVDVTSDMEISRTELFGPVMLVMRCSDVEDLVATANATRFGLGASVFGRNRKQCQEVARNLECGMVSINDFAVYYLNQSLPFGGVKASGFGRFGGAEGLRALCSTKSVCEDRFHGLIQTAIPPILAYPIDNALNSYGFVSGLITMLYAPWSESVRGLVQLVKAALANGKTQA